MRARVRDEHNDLQPRREGCTGGERVHRVELPVHRFGRLAGTATPAPASGAAEAPSVGAWPSAGIWLQLVSDLRLVSGRRRGRADAHRVLGGAVLYFITML